LEPLEECFRTQNGIYDKDYATIVNEEIEECVDENNLFSNEDPTII